jgi:hypothetical protein
VNRDCKGRYCHPEGTNAAVLVNTNLYRTLRLRDIFHLLLVAIDGLFGAGQRSNRIVTSEHVFTRSRVDRVACRTPEILAKIRRIGMDTPAPMSKR